MPRHGNRRELAVSDGKLPVFGGKSIVGPPRGLLEGIFMIWTLASIHRRHDGVFAFLKRVEGKRIIIKYVRLA